MEYIEINEVDKVNILKPTECITAIMDDKSLIQIPISELSKVMAPLVKSDMGLSRLSINTKKTIDVPLERVGDIEIFSLSRFLNNEGKEAYPGESNYMSGIRIRLMIGEGIYESQISINTEGNLFVRMISNSVLGKWVKIS